MAMKNDTLEAFKKAVETEWPSPPFKRQLAPCEDKFVGIIRRNSSGLYEFDSMAAFVYKPIPPHGDNSRLLVVLESPHEKEYLGENSPVPANGATGTNIRSYLGSLLKGLPSLQQAADLDVILVNAVPYQCSQGAKLTNHENRAKRDRVFRAAFCAASPKPGVEFERRVSRYVRAHDIVINCCTKGVTVESLRDLVHDSLARLSEKLRCPQDQQREELESSG